MTASFFSAYSANVPPKKTAVMIRLDYARGFIVNLITLASIPIAFGEPVGTALPYQSRCHPGGIRFRRHFPMTRYPLILSAAPCPIACDPHITGTRLNHSDVRLERRRGFVYNGRGSIGRSCRHGRIAGIPGDSGHRVRSRCGGCGRHRARWRGRGWCGNRIPLRPGRATGQQAEDAAKCQGWCEPPHHTHRS